MASHWLGLIEMLGIFGLALVLGLWELFSVHRASRPSKRAEPEEPAEPPI